MMYEGFSSVYDMFIDVDYDIWVEYILRLWEKYGVKPELVLELACGTGNITTRLSDKGYDMIGVDVSDSMLSIAREKSGGGGTDILYLSQDMREFELYGTVDACLCLLDGLNYILDESELLTVFQLVNNYLNPGGIFIFDINTRYKFQFVLSDNDFCRTEDDAAYIWENYYDEDESINEYCLNLFVKGSMGKYERTEEFHYQKAYDIAQIEKLVNDSGLEILDVFDELSFDKPKSNSEKIFFAIRKN